MTLITRGELPLPSSYFLLLTCHFLLLTSDLCLPLACSSPAEFIGVFPRFITNFKGDVTALFSILGNLFKKGLDFKDIYSVPTNLMSAFSKGLCLVQRVIHSMRAVLLFGQDKLYALIDLLSFGNWKTPVLPDCTLEKSGFCLGTAELSSWLYRTLLFPVQHLQFWDSASPPLIDPCRGLMKMKLTVPGLLSRYSFQSATFWAMENVVKKHFIEVSGERIPVEVQCGVPTYLMVYKPNVGKGCTGNAGSKKGNSSLIVRMTGHGELLGVQELFERIPASAAEGTPYDGSATGIAVSDNKRLVWMCGRDSPDSQDWNLLTFPRDEVFRLGFGQV